VTLVPGARRGEKQDEEDTLAKKSMQSQTKKGSAALSSKSETETLTKGRLMEKCSVRTRGGVGKRGKGPPSFQKIQITENRPSKDPEGT